MLTEVYTSCVMTTSLMEMGGGASRTMKVYEATESILINSIR